MQPAGQWIVIAERSAATQETLRAPAIREDSALAPCGHSCASTETSRSVPSMMMSLLAQPHRVGQSDARQRKRRLPNACAHTAEAQTRQHHWKDVNRAGECVAGCAPSRYCSPRAAALHLDCAHPREGRSLPVRMRRVEASALLTLSADALRSEELRSHRRRAARRTAKL